MSDEVSPPRRVPVSNAKGWMAVIMTWIVPGLGHCWLGRRGKGIFLFVLVTGLYVGGMFLSRFLNVSPERHQFYFVAECFYGGATAVATLLTQSLEMVSFNPRHDVGLLFTAIAGLLNIVVMVDIYETIHPRRDVSVDKERVLDKEGKSRE